MKMNDKDIIKILHSFGHTTKPLSKKEIGAEYQKFVTLQHSHLHRPFSTFYTFTNIFMFTKQQMAAFALVVAIGLTSATYGVDRVNALSLANDISNASNFSEYSINLDFSNVLLNGKEITKDELSTILENNMNNYSYIGGITGYTGETPEHENKDSVAAEVVEREYLLGTESVLEAGMENIEQSDITTEEFELTPEEIEYMEANPYGPGFTQAVKFLQLKDNDGVTFIGLDNTGEIIFFAGF